ncbi:MAG: HD family phosphohydrolase [Candidatus Omnitrophota bacterium]
MTNTKTKTTGNKTRPKAGGGFRFWSPRLAVFAVSFGLALFCLGFEKPSGFEVIDFQIGEPAPRSFFSPLNLTYTNEPETESLRREAARQIPAVVRLDLAETERFRKEIRGLFDRLTAYRKERAEALGVSPATEVVFPFDLSSEVQENLLREGQLEEVRKQLESLNERFAGEPRVTSEQRTAWQAQGYEMLTMVRDGKESVVRLADLPAREKLLAEAANAVKTPLSRFRKEQQAVLELFDKGLAANLQLDGEETRQRRQRAMEAVPPVQETIKKNELIIQRGMILTGDEKDRLARIQKAMMRQEVFYKMLAIAVLTFLVYLLLFFYTVFLDRKILLSLKMILLLHSILVLNLVLIKALTFWPDYMVYLLPIPLSALLVALLIHSRVGLAVGVMASLLSGPLYGFLTPVLFGSIVASSAGVLAATKVRKRIDFLKVGLAIGLSYLSVIFGFKVLEGYTMREALSFGVQGLANGFLITMPLAFLLLPVFESFFDLVTDVSLLEFSDLNHPLLRRMMVEAPGTYHHSLVVSSLSEAACEAIGANPLLARVGSYFHDIGKIARAEFFTENDPKRAAAVHEKLTPTMSCLIIMNHIPDGFELGKKHKLRRPILDFIPEHQGTGVIYYFYRKAVDQAPPGQAIDIAGFRYPGPKPQKRETAVVLLADSVEAASRSLPETTPETIRQLVRKIINDKFIDGQLDECNLTLRELHKIQESFVQNLNAILHTRIRYPEAASTDAKPDLFGSNQFSKFRVRP